MSEETSERRRRHRKRRRHRSNLSKKTKWMIAGGVAALLLVVVGLFSWGSNMLGDAKKANEKREVSQYIGFGRQTVILMNISSNDWGYTTVTLNDQYVAHVPEIPKGMQFEIFLNQFQGPNGKFERTNRVDSIKIEPKGQKPIEWTPGLE